MIMSSGFSFQQISKSVFVLPGNLPHLCIINDSEGHRNDLSDLDSETFHEIIYGKPDAAQKCAAFFFARQFHAEYSGISAIISY